MPRESSNCSRFDSSRAAGVEAEGRAGASKGALRGSRRVCSAFGFDNPPHHERYSVRLELPSCPRCLWQPNGCPARASSVFGSTDPDALRLSGLRHYDSESRIVQKQARLNQLLRRMLGRNPMLGLDNSLRRIKFHRPRLDAREHWPLPPKTGRAR